MRTLVVSESMYGNTRKVAEAVAEGIRSAATPIDTVTVGTVDGLDPGLATEADLVIVGAPTHVHGLSRSASRKSAIEDVEHSPSVHVTPDARGQGARGWLKGLDHISQPRLGAAFDTRINKPAIVTGAASKSIAKRLRRSGYRMAVDPMSFFVADSEGPLEDGEIERAYRWGQQLVVAARAKTSGR